MALKKSPCLMWLLGFHISMYIAFGISSGAIRQPGVFNIGEPLADEVEESEANESGSSFSSLNSVNCCIIIIHNSTVISSSENQPETSNDNNFLSNIITAEEFLQIIHLAHMRNYTEYNYENLTVNNSGVDYDVIPIPYENRSEQKQKERETGEATTKNCTSICNETLTYQLKTMSISNKNTSLAVCEELRKLDNFDSNNFTFFKTNLSLLENNCGKILVLHKYDEFMNESELAKIFYNNSEVLTFLSNYCTIPKKQYDFNNSRETKPNIIEIFDIYIDPIVQSIIFAIGLTWNGVLLLIFIRHNKQLLTAANIIILNLVVADILSLILNVLMFCFTDLYEPHINKNENICRYYVSVRTLPIALSALSVVALSIVRFMATEVIVLKSKAKLLNKYKGQFLVTMVWILSVCLAFPYVFMVTFSNGKCLKYGHDNVFKIVTLCEFLFYCVFLPSIIMVFNSLTAKRLKKSTREISIKTTLKQNGQDVVRERSAKVLRALMIIFVVSYTPHYMLRIMRPWTTVDDDYKVTFTCVYKMSYYLVYMNYCFNPISLYVVSGTFRRYFNYYFSCMKIPYKDQ